MQPNSPITGSDPLPYLSKTQTDNTGQGRNRGHLPWAPSNLAFLTVERDRDREGRWGESKEKRETETERHTKIEI